MTGFGLHGGPDHRVAVITVNPHSLDFEPWLKAAVPRARNVAAAARPAGLAPTMTTSSASREATADVFRILDLLGLISATQREAVDKSASFFGMVVTRPTMPAQSSAGDGHRVVYPELADEEADYGWSHEEGGITEGNDDGQHSARILDALVEGLSIHRALDNEPDDQAIVSAAVQRITAKSEIRRV
jgi:hypothetical protein